MGTPKLTGFIIGLILITLVASVFSLFLTDLSSNYQSNTGSYNDSTLSKYAEKTDNLKQDINKTVEATKVDAESSWADILGGYFSAAIRSVKISFSSFDILNTMLGDGMNDIGASRLGDGFKPFKIAFQLIITVLIFVGILVAIMVKWRTI